MGDFWRLRRSWKAKGEKEPERRKKRGEKREQILEKPTSFEEKGRRSCIPKSSYTQIISEGEVRSLISVYNK